MEILRPAIAGTLESSDCMVAVEPVEFGDRVVGIIEARDGTIMDVVREIKD